MSQTVLVVEDEQDLLHTLDYNLKREGYTTYLAPNGTAALDLTRQKSRPDLILLDVMLPDISGLEVCRRLREDDRTKSIPVLMLTAKGEEFDRVLGFELGADDYVTKPFSLRELLLRIRALLRRSHSYSDETSQDLEFGCLRIDELAHDVWVDDDRIQLTQLEWNLLRLLVHRRGRVQTRDVLLTDVWKMDATVTTRTVDTHVKRLRQKLRKAGHYIETIRGAGYRFAIKPTEYTS